MALHMLGKDPDSKNGGSPTVYYDDETGNCILQGWKVSDAARLAQLSVKRRGRHGTADHGPTPGARRRAPATAPPWRIRHGRSIDRRTLCLMT
ncbi:hypothetical protein GCM10009838_34720 [Catenulispora subtropica]|uniref:Uncharacterized protein n=1 Tax=Catenulispora subtropica TaxID=450798 RepID=A0ABN2RNJ2_9ACTN